jgi:hypothetical protein
MPVAKGIQKVDRYTVTLVPTTDDAPFEHIPTTFSATHRLYEWRRAARMKYMIVPRKVSGREIQIDFFLDPTSEAAASSKMGLKSVEQFFQRKIASEWKGLKLTAVGKPIEAQAPSKVMVRGTIEEMLGTKLIR